ncbi:MAG: Na/Pi cotransporter family protein [Bacteriovoracaceae bacterium]|jgi:phosphate:Na+ symporter|nr:Na/Pi cotransporter family protein [Bacteriovoracaceae bacterium]
MDTFKIIYTMLGGLGIFFFGMKQMSDSLQQMAGDVITKVINSLTTNRLLAVTVGMIVTMIVQSSSVTTVMVVGFVNAGLMQLTQAIGVIFGSNIGTTITGWIISIKVGKYGLLFIGLGIFPALFSKNKRYQNLGKVVFGVGMIFLGLQTMSGAFKPLRANAEFLNLVSYFSGSDYGSYFASILMGCLLTVIIQSSSAMLGITIALASTGIINFNTAAALVLGENIGTTITAILASIGTSTNAKRAARAHAIFNVLGVLAIFAVLPLYINFIEMIIPGDANFISSDGSKPNIAAHIAASHTIFNVSATLLFLPFLPALARLVTRITPSPEVKKKPRLEIVGDASEIVPAAAIAQVDAEIRKMKDILDRMYKVTSEYLVDGSAKKLAKIKDYELITDNMQKEVTVFLCQVMEKPMSSEQTRRAQGLVKIADEYESIADYLERIASYRARFKDSEAVVSGVSNDEYFEFMKKVWEFFEMSTVGLFEPISHNETDIVGKSEKLRVLADDIRDKHLQRVSKKEYSPLSALTYSDMVVALRKIRQHACNVGETITLINQK